MGGGECIIGTVVVAFCWWGVYLRNGGLHSYGFTEGIQQVLNWFYGVEGTLIALSLLVALIQSRRSSGSSGLSSTSK